MNKLGLGALILCVYALPANAQATRTWVSGVGSDANSCSRSAPCATFSAALTKTNTGGEINCVDAGGFGAFLDSACVFFCFQSDSFSFGERFPSHLLYFGDNLFADAQVALGAVLFFADWSWDAAARSLQRALQLNPNHSEGLLVYGQLLEALGRLEEGLQMK